jgi:hypothetical protein
MSSLQLSEDLAITKSADNAPERRKDITLRLTIPQWTRVKALSVEIEQSMQQIAIAGINRIFQERGHDPLDPESTILPTSKKRKPRA